MPETKKVPKLKQPLNDGSVSKNSQDPKLGQLEQENTALD
jgi:hypothetical protein